MQPGTPVEVFKVVASNGPLRAPERAWVKGYQFVGPHETIPKVVVVFNEDWCCNVNFQQDAVRPAVSSGDAKLLDNP